jgi:hypothetical protein
MVKPGVNVLSTPFEDLLTKHYRLCGGIDKEVVFRHLSAWTERCPTIVAKVKDASLNTKPGDLISKKIHEQYGESHH